jgi:dTDP-4-dehydrorhamnose reductase
MRIVVTGREGQIVRSLLERAPIAGHHVIALGRPELDLASDADSIVRAITSAEPDIVISAAAYTAVDRAEDDREAAFAVNERGAAAVARAARERGVPVVHISTDYVFDGAKTGAYVESDATAPGGVYGASKLAGERAVLAEQPDGAILRTAWVYSPFGTNFAKTMLRLASDRGEVRVVADQRGNPTSAFDIADGAIAVASNLVRSDDRGLRGTFHMTAAGEASWAEFAQAIFEQSARLGGPSAVVTPISTADYPTAARRPANSSLDSTKLERVHGVRLPRWRDSVGGVVARLIGGKASEMGVQVS